MVDPVAGQVAFPGEPTVVEKVQSPGAAGLYDKGISIFIEFYQVGASLTAVRVVAGKTGGFDQDNMSGMKGKTLIS